jgi:small subunit ribosomal protein S6
MGGKSVSCDEQGSFDLAQNYYEGMFLLDSGKYAASPDNTTGHVLEILQKAGGSVVAHRPWADGKLAYPVKGHRKGLHLLTYFTMPSEGLSELTRQVHLSEIILRHLVLKHPKVLFDAMVGALSGKEGTFRHVENVDEAPRPARRGRDEEAVEDIDAVEDLDDR